MRSTAGMGRRVVARVVARRLLMVMGLVSWGIACGGRDGTGNPAAEQNAGGSGKGGGSGTSPDPFGNAQDGAVEAMRPINDAAIGPETGGCGQLKLRNLDLLFMVDDSGSMQQEQEALRREFPKMIKVLTTGDRNDDGVQDVPPIAELHLGVVSSDLGLPGISDIHGCMNLGDDGVMNSVPGTDVSGCDVTYPRFIEFVAERDQPDKTANDFACVASLGTTGCGFEQQLESSLKALWPSSDDSIEFLADVSGLGNTGQGDRSNAGFLRPSSGEETSMLAIVQVTDEDDCSSPTTEHLRSPQALPAGDPLLQQGLNTRCFHNEDKLYPVQRYIDGFKRLRPLGENLVVFAAITGVPLELVTPDRLTSVSFDDPTAVKAFYDEILAAPAMQQVVDTGGTPDPSDDKMTPSCMSESGIAFPPRRIVEVARGFGKNSIVQSICQSDFGPAIDAIVLAIARAVDDACIVR